MNSVGIFTTTRSLQHIMDIDQEIRTFCNVTYLPYTTLEHRSISMSKRGAVRCPDIQRFLPL